MVRPVMLVLLISAMSHNLWLIELVVLFWDVRQLWWIGFIVFSGNIWYLRLRFRVLLADKTRTFSMQGALYLRHALVIIVFFYLRELRGKFFIRCLRLNSCLRLSWCNLILFFNCASDRSAFQWQRHIADLTRFWVLQRPPWTLPCYRLHSAILLWVFYCIAQEVEIILHLIVIVRVVAEIACLITWALLAGDIGIALAWKFLHINALGNTRQSRLPHAWRHQLWACALVADAHFFFFPI